MVADRAARRRARILARAQKRNVSASPRATPTPAVVEAVGSVKDTAPEAVATAASPRSSLVPEVHTSQAPSHRVDSDTPSPPVTMQPRQDQRADPPVLSQRVTPVSSPCARAQGGVEQGDKEEEAVGSKETPLEDFTSVLNRRRTELRLERKEQWTHDILFGLLVPFLLVCTRGVWTTNTGKDSAGWTFTQGWGAVLTVFFMLQVAVAVVFSLLRPPQASAAPPTDNAQNTQNKRSKSLAEYTTVGVDLLARLGVVGWAVAHDLSLCLFVLSVGMWCVS